MALCTRGSQGINRTNVTYKRTFHDQAQPIFANEVVATEVMMQALFRVV